MKHKKIRGLPMPKKHKKHESKKHEKKEHHSEKAPKKHANKYSKKAEKKISKVMHEFGEGKLHSGSKKGPKVSNRKQAIAIGISEAKRRGMKVPKKKK
jgi:hypothetical protein